MNTTARRPTERAAMGSAGRYRLDLPPMHVLLTGRCVARLVGDRHGIQIFTCAIERKARQETAR